MLSSFFLVSQAYLPPRCLWWRCFPSTYDEDQACASSLQPGVDSRCSMRLVPISYPISCICSRCAFCPGADHLLSIVFVVSTLFSSNYPCHAMHIDALYTIIRPSWSLSRSVILLSAPNSVSMNQPLHPYITTIMLSDPTPPRMRSSALPSPRLLRYGPTSSTPCSQSVSADH